jgi:predicted transposase YbfD/YdcC
MPKKKGSASFQTGLSQSQLTKRRSSPVNFWFAKTAKRLEKIGMDYSKQEQNEYGLIFDIGSLYEHLLQIEDPRKARGKQYPLIALLVLMLLAKLGGEDTPSGIAEWIAHRNTIWVECKILGKPKTASHMTYRRILQKIITAEAFEKIVQKYHRARLRAEQELMISVDGKTVRGTIPYGANRGIHLLAVYVPGQGLVLAQAEVGKKENEIVVAPKIISQVLLAGMIVVADAMHTQKAFSTQVVSAGANYVWTVKDNQPRTRWAIQKLFVQEVCNLQKGVSLSADIQIATTINKRHGRIEQRTLMSSTQLNDYLDWPHVAQVFRIERIVQHAHAKGTTREVVYGLTSLTPQEAEPEKLLAFFREYWKIENGLHYRRDVTFREDATRLTIGDAGHNMAILNNLAIGLCLYNGYPNVASARRLFGAHPETALALITKNN